MNRGDDDGDLGRMISMMTDLIGAPGVTGDMTGMSAIGRGADDRLQGLVAAHREIGVVVDLAGTAMSVRRTVPRRHGHGQGHDHPRGLRVTELRTMMVGKSARGHEDVFTVVKKEPLLLPKIRKINI